MGNNHSQEIVVGRALQKTEQGDHCKKLVRYLIQNVNTNIMLNY